MNTKLFPILCILLFSVTSLMSDTLLMRDGRRIEGKVEGQTRTTIKINQDGRVSTYQKSDIKRVEYGSIAPKPVPVDPKILEQEKAAQKKAEEEKRKVELEIEKKAKQEEEKRLEKEAEESRRREKEEKARLKEERKIQEKQKEDAMRAQNKNINLWPSAFVPGMYQIKNNQTKTGISYASLFGVSFLYAASSYSNQNTLKKTYIAGGNEMTTNILIFPEPAYVFYAYDLDKENKAAYKSSVQSANLGISLMSVVYIASFAHSAFSHRSSRSAASFSRGGAFEMDFASAPCSSMDAGGFETKVRGRYVLRF